MLNLDLKARLKNKSFWVAMIGAIVLLSQQLGLDISKFVPSNYVDIINTIFLILTMVGIVVDTSTSGINDQVLSKNNQGNAMTITSTGMETTGKLTIKDDSINASVQANIDNSASSKIVVDNPDNLASIGQEVNATSAVAPQ